MTMDTVAKVSAIYLTVAMMAGITLSLWPSSEYDMAQASPSTSFVLK